MAQGWNQIQESLLKVMQVAQGLQSCCPHPTAPALSKRAAKCRTVNATFEGLMEQDVLSQKEHGHAV